MKKQKDGINERRKPKFGIGPNNLPKNFARVAGFDGLQSNPGDVSS